MSSDAATPSRSGTRSTTPCAGRCRQPGTRAGTPSACRLTLAHVVRDEEQKQRVAELNRRASAEAAREQASYGKPLPHHGVEKRRRMWEAVLWQSEHMHEAPAIIVACAVLDHPGQDPNRFASSIWPGIQNLLLAARATGLGAVPTTYALRFRDDLHEVLGLPDDVAAQAIIPVGFPVGNFGPVTRRPTHEITMFDRWDGPHPAVPT